MVLASEAAASFEKMGMSVWFNVRMNDRSTAAMEEGVKNSKYFVAVVTGPCVNNDAPNDDPKGNAYFRRPYCIKELRWAKEAGKFIQPIIRLGDKGNIGPLLGLLEEPLKIDGEMQDLNDLCSLGGTDWKDLNRNDIDYWDLGMKNVCAALENSSEKKTVDTLHQNTSAETQDNVRNSQVFILFLSKGIFTKRSVRLEIQEAIKSNKTIFLLQAGKFDFEAALDEVPKMFQSTVEMLSKLELFEWGTQNNKQEDVLDKIKDCFYKSIGS